MKNNKAFTLIELIVVLAILAILATLAVPRYSSLVKTSTNAALKTSVSNLHSYMLLQQNLDDFDDEHFFTYKRSQDDGGEEFFSGFLEIEWELVNGPGDSDNSNLLGAINPFSKKTGIVNWNNPTNLGEFYWNHAVYITNSSTASYTIAKPKTVNKCYKGAIIIWYDSSYASNIYIYYVDTDGKQSSDYKLIHRESA